jgi:hypothetical protein
MTVALTPIMPGGAALGVAVISRIAQISTEVVMALIARLVARRSADRSAVS